MGAPGVPVVKRVPRVWEKLGLRKYLVLGVCLVCGKYLNTRGVPGCPRNSCGSGVKGAKEYLGSREYRGVQGIARFQE